MKKKSEEILNELVEARFAETLVETKQNLIDITFEIAFAIHTNKRYFENKTKDEIMDWVSDRLAGCGYPTIPCGSSWGVLTSQHIADQYKRANRITRGIIKPEIFD